MNNDVFGQLTFSLFVTVATVEGHSRDKRVTMATVHCRLSECDENFEAFKAKNERIAPILFAEFSFRECL